MQNSDKSHKNNIQYGGANGEVNVPRYQIKSPKLIKIRPDSHYKTDYIVNNYEHFIDNEMKTIGTCDIELATKVKKYITTNPEFFTTEFHKNVDDS